MSIKKSLGGNRLGSGNKMDVQLHSYERSSHDMGYIWRSTMSAGTLVPFLVEVALPGDTFDIDLEAYANTHPTIGPCFASAKMQLDIFQAPIRLYQGQLHNNKLGIGMKMANVKLPVISQVTTQYPSNYAEAIDFDNAQINPSSIFAYLGIRGIGFHHTSGTEQIRSFNAVPFLAYWDIYKNYYANKQEEIGAVIHSQKPTINFTVNSVTLVVDGANKTIPQFPAGSPLDALMKPGTWMEVDFTGTFDPELFILNFAGGSPSADECFLYNTQASATIWRFYNPNYAIVVPNAWVINWNYADVNTPQRDNPPKVVTFPLENIDTMREEILMGANLGSTAFNVNAVDIPPYSLALARQGTAPDYYYSRLASQEGLALKTYQSDLFNNWLSTEWIDGADGISAVTAIDTSSGSFTIDTLNLSKKVYDMLNRIAVSGGTYDDWLDVTYTHDRITRAESPIYHGGLIKELIFQEVISQSSGIDQEAGTQPLGSLAGKGLLSGKHKGGRVTIHVDEPSYIIGIISLTPRIDYSQGNKWDINLQTMDDFHKPALDEIGFQELMTEQMAWWSSNYDAAGNREKWSAGKQPAWINYMTNVNVVRGNFAVKDNQMFMVFNRNYEVESPVGYPGTNNIKDLTTYIDPAKFNHIFAQTSRDAQNFWIQLGIDMTVRRKMSAKLIPNL